MQSSHKTNLQGHSNVSSNNWMARPTQQHWPLASPAQLQLWVSPFRPAAATSISAFDDITRKERIRRKTMQSNPLTKLIFKATPTSRQTIGWLDPPNNTGLWLLLRNFRFGFLHFVLPQPDPFLLLMILQAITVYNSCLGLGKHSGT